MSGWTHPVCIDCWNQRHAPRSPLRSAAAPVEVCCFCEAVTVDGIYEREDPELAPCGGMRGYHDGDM